ncbi:MAG: NUDIX domain-containing protein [Proteobacteria bacterium]|nr:NUDIX domain-containing protein [Pseudomonadota bacterium]
MKRLVQRFEVSLKAFIVHDGKALFVRESDSGYWELPGGRIDVGEEWEAHSDVLAREIREELGGDFMVSLGTEAVSWTRQRPTDGVFLFLVARLGCVVSGTPLLSDEHVELAWLDEVASLGLNFPPSSGYRQGISELWRLTRAARVR